MNDQQPAQPIESSVRKTMGEIEDFARREPTKAVAAAFGVGLLINLLPTRLVIGAATAVGATLMRPTLLTLGVTKAFELCFPSNKKQTRL